MFSYIALTIGGAALFYASEAMKKTTLLEKRVEELEEKMKSTKDT